MMACSGRRLWPVCGISRPRSSAISACSLATGPTPWPKKGGWHWLLGLQTPEGRDNHGYVLAPVPVAPVNETDMVLFPEGLKALKDVATEVGLDLRGAYLKRDGG